MTPKAKSTAKPKTLRGADSATDDASAGTAVLNEAFSQGGLLTFSAAVAKAADCPLPDYIKDQSQSTVFFDWLSQQVLPHLRLLVGELLLENPAQGDLSDKFIDEVGQAFHIGEPRSSRTAIPQDALELGIQKPYGVSGATLIVLKGLLGHYSQYLLELFKKEKAERTPAYRQARDTLKLLERIVNSWALQRHSANDEEQILTEVKPGCLRLAGAIEKGRRETGRKELEAHFAQAVKLLRSPEAWQAVALPWILSSRQPDFPLEQVSTAWVNARLVRWLLDKVFDWKDVLVDLYVPTPLGEIRVWVSSSTDFPVLVNDREALTVKKGCFAGGLVTLLKVPFFADAVIQAINSNDSEEGNPAQFATLPLELPLKGSGTFGWGQLHVAVRVVSDHTMSQPEVRGLLLKLAERFQKALGGPAPRIPWWAWLVPIETLEDLDHEIQKRHGELELQAIETAIPRGASRVRPPRDVLTLIVPRFEPREFEPGLWESVLALAEMYARRLTCIFSVSRAGKVYELPDLGFVVYFRNVTENEWRKLRDRTEDERGPHELREATGQSDPADNARLVAVLYEYSPTIQWPVQDVNDTEIWGKAGTYAQELAQDHISKIAMHIEQVNQFRIHVEKGEHADALEVGGRLKEQMGRAGTVLLNSLSRCAFLDDENDDAKKYAEERIDEVPWDLTAHANLLYPMLEEEDLAGVQAHMRSRLKGDTCSFCTRHRIQVLKTRVPEPNGSLTAALFLAKLGDEVEQTKFGVYATVVGVALKALLPNSRPVIPQVSQFLRSSYGLKRTDRELKEWAKSVIQIQRALGKKVVSPKERETLKRFLWAAKGVLKARNLPVQLSLWPEGASTEPGTMPAGGGS